jgi:hypothetical protein
VDEPNWDDEDIELFNTAYRLYLDGTFAAGTPEKEEAADAFIGFIDGLSRKRRFILLCVVMDQMYAKDVALGLAEGELPPPLTPDTPEGL